MDLEQPSLDDEHRTGEESDAMAEEIHAELAKRHLGHKVVK